MSPNGEIEFRIFIAVPPEDAGVTRLAYQVSRRGSPLLETSFLGIDILNQEPMLGQNLGLMSATQQSSDKYHGLTADYMQDGSLGRRVNVEVRVYDDGVAFRYILPQSTPLKELVIHDEATEFAFAQPAPGLVEGAASFATRQPGGWVGIAEIAEPAFAPMYLTRYSESILTARLRKKKDSNVAFEGTTPLTFPWRVLVIGYDAEHLGQSIVVNDLKAESLHR